MNRCGEENNVLIRQLTPKDEAILWEILYHAVHVPEGEASPPREIVYGSELARYVAGWMQREDDLGFAAELRGSPIGAAWLRRWPSAERGYGFVDASVPELSMALLPGYRGLGYGTRLLNHLLNATRQHFSGVSLSVSVDNPARRLYERMGFRPVAPASDGSITMIWGSGVMTGHAAHSIDGFLPD